MQPTIAFFKLAYEIKYKGFTPSDMGFRKLIFVAKTQFLCTRMHITSLFCPEDFRKMFLTFPIEYFIIRTYILKNVVNIMI